MSRIGRKPIPVPAGVSIERDGNSLTIKGPKGTLSQSFSEEMNIEITDTEILVVRPTDGKLHRSLHGLTRTLISNMVVGVHEGFKKELEVQGTGYRVAKEGNVLSMTLGYSHLVKVPEIEGITIEVPQPNRIIIHGTDKQKVGQFAAEVREKRPPEPYKGKGVRYLGEVIIRKEGKAGKGKK